MIQQTRFLPGVSLGGGKRMAHPNQKIPVEILLVEDSQDDADLMMEALREGMLPLTINWVEDGEEALAFLRRQGDHQNAARPDLVILDLRLPRMNGQEVLQAIRGDPELQLIPVVIMTSNDAAIPEVYDYHPNCCVTKPADQQEFIRAVKKIERFWLTVATRPPK